LVICGQPGVCLTYCGSVRFVNCADWKTRCSISRLTPLAKNESVKLPTTKWTRRI
jgi:hypothetical protein